MALGYSVRKYFNKNVQYRRRIVDITLDANYVAGGYSINAADCGLNGIIGVTPMGGGPVVPLWDANAAKLKFYRAGAANDVLTECANNQANMVNSVVSIMVEGY